MMHTVREPNRRKNVHTRFWTSSKIRAKVPTAKKKGEDANRENERGEQFVRLETLQADRKHV